MQSAHTIQPQLLTPEKAPSVAVRGGGDELLVEPPDPNLCCAICHQLFRRPTRTSCGSVAGSEGLRARLCDPMCVYARAASTRPAVVNA